MFRLLYISMMYLLISPLAVAAETDKQPSTDHERTALNSEDTKEADSKEGNADNTEETDDDIANDLQLLDKEFHGYETVRERRFGVLLGVGATSPRHDFHLELTYAPLQFIRLSLSVDVTRRSDTTDSETMTSITLRTRHHLKILPIFFGTITGGTKDSIVGLLNPAADEGSASSKYNYNSTSIYGGILVGAYYFWRFGLYLETTIAGVSYHHALNTDISGNSGASNSIQDIKDKLADKIIGAKLFGLFNGGLNIAIGYMF